MWNITPFFTNRAFSWRRHALFLRHMSTAYSDASSNSITDYVRWYSLGEISYSKNILKSKFSSLFRAQISVLAAARLDVLQRRSTPSSRNIVKSLFPSLFRAQISVRADILHALQRRSTQSKTHYAKDNREEENLL